MSRILVIDDIQANRELAEYLLKTLGHEITLASSGEEAHRLATAQPFDLVLSDMHMPEADGFAVLAAFQADPATRRLPLVLFTLSATEPEVERAQMAGFLAIVPKPRDPQAFMKTVTEVIAAHALNA